MLAKHQLFLRREVLAAIQIFDQNKITNLRNLAMKAGAIQE
jgi:hypothetical protein